MRRFAWYGPRWSVMDCGAVVGGGCGGCSSVRGSRCSLRRAAARRLPADAFSSACCKQIAEGTKVRYVGLASTKLPYEFDLVLAREESGVDERPLGSIVIRFFRIPRKVCGIRTTRAASAAWRR